MRYLLRKVLFYSFTAFIAITINFFVPRMMAGDPVAMMMGRFQGRMDPRAIDSLRKTFGFVEGPLHVQYWEYIKSLFQGNLGISISAFPAPVTELLGYSLMWTIRLLVVALIISFLLGTIMGTIAAWKRGKVMDSYVLPTLAIVGAFPYFFIALLMVYFLGLKAGWFPLSLAFDKAIRVDWSNPDFWGSVLQHAILPAFTIVITSISGWMLGMRNNMIGVLSQEYITLAEAKGLSNMRVMYNYAARNAILPSITGFAMSLGFILGGALVTEVVFSYPGMGSLLLSAVNSRDYPLMQGGFLVITFAVLLANFLVDILYVVLDPRVR